MDKTLPLRLKRKLLQIPLFIFVYLSSFIKGEKQNVSSNKTESIYNL